MSDAFDIPEVGDLDYDKEQVKRFLHALRDLTQAREPSATQIGDVMDKFISRREALNLGLLTYADGTFTGAAGGAGSAGPPGPPGAPAPAPAADTTPASDLTGLTSVSLFAGAFLEWDAATYTQGGGNGQTDIYAANYSGTGPLPTFADAVLVGSAIGLTNVYVDSAQLGVQRHYWAKQVTAAGYPQASPSGGVNGLQVTIGKVGSADLGSLIVQAGNIAANAVDASKFAAGIEPVAVVSALPSASGYTGPKTVLLTTDGKVYRYASGAWTKAVDGADIVANSITAGQVAVGGLAAGAIAVGSAAIENGAIRRALIEDLAVDTAKIANLAVNNAKIASLDASKITTGFLDATRIAAGTIDVTKLNTNGLTVRDALGNIILSSGVPLDWARVTGTAKPKAYRVSSAGYAAYLAGKGVGQILNADDNSLSSGSGYMWNVLKMSRATGAWSVVGYWSTLVNGATDAAAMAAALNAIGNDHIVVIFTHDEPATNRLLGGLPQAMYRCGASSGIFGADKFNYRSAYILIGIPGCGEGNGHEVLASASLLGEANALCETTFSVVNGNPVFSSGTSVPEINSSNVSTYIASAAIQDAQIASLNATKIVAGTITTDKLNVNVFSGNVYVDDASKFLTLTNGYYIGADYLSVIPSGAFTRRVATSVLDINVNARFDIDLKSSFGGPPAGQYDVIVSGYVMAVYNGGSSFFIVGYFDSIHGEYCDASDQKDRCYSISRSVKLQSPAGDGVEIRLQIAMVEIVTRVNIGRTLINAINTVKVRADSSISERVV